MTHFTMYAKGRPSVPGKTTSGLIAQPALNCPPSVGMECAKDLVCYPTKPLATNKLITTADEPMTVLASGADNSLGVHGTTWTDSGDRTATGELIKWQEKTYVLLNQSHVYA